MPTIFSILICLFTTINIAFGAQIAGTISKAGSSQEPVFNARISLFSTNLALFLETRSESEGSYRFNDVASGTYQLGVAARYYGYQEITISVGNADITRTFLLNP